MKKTLFFTAALIFCATLWAQVPEGISHQAEPTLGQNSSIKHNPDHGNFNQQPLEQLLNANGTLNLTGSFSGSLDPTGFQMLIGPDGEPIFIRNPQDDLDNPAYLQNQTRSEGDENWHQFPWPSDGFNDRVRTIAVSGSDVYVGGLFTEVGGVSASRIAKWDGNSWLALGSGVAGTGVSTIAVSDSDVYVGGWFFEAGGVSTSHIARWDGASWSALGSGVSGFVSAIAISGSNVYVGGDFTEAGGVSANHIARWNGTSWSALGNGVNDVVWEITVCGNNVYVGGNFTEAGEVSASRIAKWDGTSWSALGSGVDSSVLAIAVSGIDVYVGGGFAQAGGLWLSRIAKWDGTSWSALGSGFFGEGSVQAIAISGSDVYVGGNFIQAGGQNANYVARWDGMSWSALGSGVNNQVEAIAVSENDIYFGGRFTEAGGLASGYFANWNETDHEEEPTWPPCPDMPTVTDIEGNVYNTVLIGGQCWIRENLRVTKYNNGNDITTGLSNEEWGSTTEGAYAIYPHSFIGGLNSDEEVLEAYGALYNWYAVNTGNLCPEGWSVPSDADWTALVNYVADQGFPNFDVVNGAGNALKSCRQVGHPDGGDCDTSEHPRWNSHDTHYGFDEIGFLALPGGTRFTTNYFGIGYLGRWWSSSENSSSTGAWRRTVGSAIGNVLRNSSDKSNGYSVRCFRDSTEEPTLFNLNLELSPENAGNVQGAGQFQEGEEVHIFATANEGWGFVNWTGDTDYVADPGSATTTVTMPAFDITLTANFAVLHELTLNVDMSPAPGFVPGVDAVYVTGSFWGDWIIPGDDPDNQLMAPEGDTMIWTKTINLAPGDYQYKYFMNEGWDGGEWGGEPNREITVTGDMVVDDTWGQLDDPDVIEVETLAELRTKPPGETIYRYTGEAMIVAMPDQSVLTPFIYSDFEENQNVVFQGWPNWPTIIANPDPSEINPGTHVAQWHRSAENIAHVYAELDGKIDFSEQQVFSFKIWSPIACEVLFKLEDKTDHTIAFEVSQNVTDTEQWVELSFDFSDAESGMYDKIVIFMDVFSTEDNIFYFDDVTGPSYEGAEKTGSVAFKPGTTDRGPNRNRKFIQDETAAIFIFDAPGNITTSYNLYDVITNVTGQIEVLNNMVRFLPTQNAPEALGNTPVEPYLLAMDEVTPNDQAKLIKFNNVTFEGIEVGEVFATEQNYTLTDGVNTFVLRTLFWDEDYIGMEIPHGTLSITGVVTQFHDQMQITPRFAADIEDHYAEEEWPPCPDMPTVTDIDGNVYNTVIIGEQCWIRENLRVTKYNNGNDITTGLSNAEWGSTTEGAYAIYDQNAYNTDGINSPEEMVAAYGKLYNWYAVDDSRGLCPQGWSVPSDDDWTQLVNYVVAQGYPNELYHPNGAGNALKSCRQVDSPLGGGCDTSEHPRWNSHDTHSGFDEFGFSALPGGCQLIPDGGCSPVGYSGYWWSSSEHSSTDAWLRSVNRNIGNVNSYSSDKHYGFSVRCFRDSTEEPTLFNLNLELSPENAGNVQGAGQFQEGEEVHIFATANEGWGFVNWTGDTDYVDDPGSATTTVTMPAFDITLTANFAVLHELTLNVDMSPAPDFDPETDLVYVTGTFVDFWPIPGSDPDNQLMTRVGETMIWTKTINLVPGNYQYKYFMNEGWDGGEWVGDPNREITVTGDMVVDDTWGYIEPIEGGNIMVVHDATASTNGVVTIELEIINEDEFVGFNTDIALPSGFTYVPGSAQLHRDDGHFFNFDILPGNVARMLSAAIPTAPFPGNDGVIVSFDLQTPGAEGTFHFCVSDAVIVDENGVNIMTGDICGVITLVETSTVIFLVTNYLGYEIDHAVITLGGVENPAGDYVFENVEQGTHPYIIEKDCYLVAEDFVVVSGLDVYVEELLGNILGDANDDGVVNVSDVVIIVNYFMGQSPDPFCFINADVNGDGVINVSDVVGATNIFMGGKISPHEGLKSQKADVYLYPEGIYIESDGTLTAMQFELTGKSLEALSMALTLPTHQIMHSINDNKLTAMVFSLSNAPIPGGKLRIIDLEPVGNHLQWGEVLVANLNADLADVETHSDEATGVAGIEGVDNIRVYPNPAKDVLWIELENNSGESVEVSLKNIHGQHIKNEVISGQGHVKTGVGISELPAGAYMLRFKTSRSGITKRVIVGQ